jgi:FkbM family methyltransferase
LATAGERKGIFEWVPPEKVSTEALYDDPLTCAQLLINNPVRDIRTHAREYPPDEIYRTSFDEELIVFKNMFLDGLKPKLGGFYLEMGAFDGVTEANTRFFENCLGWRGLLIEASPRTFKMLKKNRPNNHLVNAAPSCKTSSTFTMVDSDMTNAAGVEFEKAENTATISCIPMSQLLADLSITHIDFFSLDVEGAELAVLETIDFNAVRIDVIIAESRNRLCQDPCPKRDAVRKLMKTSGYILDDVSMVQSLVVTFCDSLDLEPWPWLAVYI